MFLSGTAFNRELRLSSEARVELKARANEHIPQRRDHEDGDMKDYPLRASSREAPDSLRSQVTGVLEPHSVV